MLEPDGAREAVTCPACGQTLPREDAREYDKFGDNFDHEAKPVEYFCQDCYEELSFQDRTGLEELLIEIGAGDTTDATFLRELATASEDRDGSKEEC